MTDMPYILKVHASDMDYAHLWWDHASKSFTFYVVDRNGRIDQYSHSDSSATPLQSIEALLSWARQYLDTDDPDTLAFLRAAEQDRQHAYTADDPGVGRLLARIS